MPELEVVRWRKFGMDRLYVNTAEGSRVGWVDLVTGAQTVEIEEHRVAFVEAVRDHDLVNGSRPKADDALPEQHPCESAKPAARTAPAASVVIDPPTPLPQELLAPPQPSWTDLSRNRPGEAVREQALACQQAAPLRTWFDRVLGQRNDERAWRLGVNGETKVAAQLAKLPETWRVLHAIPVGTRGSDIDHIAIGPGGVYTINAKNHPDANVWVGGNVVMVNGAKTDYVRNSRHEAERASRLLTAAAGFPVFVSGLVVIVNASTLKVKSQPPGNVVSVVARRRLVEWLSRRGEVLSAEQVDALFDASRRSTTWT